MLLLLHPSYAMSRNRAHLITQVHGACPGTVLLRCGTHSVQEKFVAGRFCRSAVITANTVEKTAEVHHPASAHWDLGLIASTPRRDVTSKESAT
ncbi:hypothetical protein ElyMa_002126700 [Elysia marginata]|uniref:Secreted protein n=1 Tax=Elysia marginata TaxID=1093978 RepID=A0AAV4FK21_9GAST|nr:hypothetical protein ElyMa_002126700 [Elysia marginata]